MDWKHIALGALFVVGAPLVHYLMGIDWSHLGPYSVVIGGGLQILNEVLTNQTPKS